MFIDRSLRCYSPLASIKFNMKTNISATHCAVESCPTTILNKPPAVAFHPCPTSTEMRNKWMKVLKNKCFMLDWSKSRICSRHFESKSFDSQRRLKENAVPSIFATFQKLKAPEPKTRLDKLLNQLTQAELTNNINNSLSKLKEPSDLDSYFTDNMQCKPGTPLEAQLWLMVKKQKHLNNRLRDLVIQSNKHTDILQKDLEDAAAIRMKNEQSIESLKFIAKCLQEKHATLEEQIEILTAVESR